MSVGAVLNQLGGGVPSGVIVMWSGETTNIPSGWFLCDGQNGTPDLRNRFIVGAGSTYSVNSTGGEATHALSVAEMPSHNHNISGNISGDLKVSINDSTAPESNQNVLFSYNTFFSNGQGGNYLNYENVGITTNANSLSIANTGSSQPHNNLPPYYALAYIMKA